MYESKLLNLEENMGKKDIEEPLTPQEILKYEVAEELGLMDKIREGGWKSLTAKESGKIGGMMTTRKRKLKNEQSQA